jgi:hypothetical protein
MLTVAAAYDAWWSPGESIDSHERRRRDSSFQRSHSPVDAMVEPVIRPHAPRFVARLRIVRAAPLDVHAWTGRSAVSAATNTVRPPIATAGTGRTRVSVARLLRSRTWQQRTPRALARSVISPPKHRRLANPQNVSG